MKTNFLKLFAFFTVLFSVVVLADSSYAQPRQARGKIYTKAEAQQIIKRVENRVDTFVRQYDRSLDNSSLNGSNREDWLNKRAKNLESATDELRRDFDKRDLWVENQDEVRRCLNIATDINKNIKNKRYGRATENNWRAVVYELNTLAKLYNVPQIGSRAY
jgi:Skp family chaperone for outer membrane proteins